MKQFEDAVKELINNLRKITVGKFNVDVLHSCLDQHAVFTVTGRTCTIVPTRADNNIAALLAPHIKCEVRQEKGKYIATIPMATEEVRKDKLKEVAFYQEIAKVKIRRQRAKLRDGGTDDKTANATTKTYCDKVDAICAIKSKEIMTV